MFKMCEVELGEFLTVSVSILFAEDHKSEKDQAGLEPLALR